MNESDVRVKEALAKLRMQENMRDQFQSRLANLKIFPITVVYEAGPTMEGEKPDYKQMKSTGVDTVNEIVVQKLTLTGRGIVRPDLAVHLEMQVRLISTLDNGELYSKLFKCSSKYDKFEVWAAKEAQKFHDEIESCYNDVAQRAVNDLYVNNSLMRM